MLAGNFEILRTRGRIERVVLDDQGLDIALHGGKWCAQVVGDVRHELAAQPVVFLQRGKLLLNRGRHVVASIPQLVDLVARRVCRRNRTALIETARGKRRDLARQLPQSPCQVPEQQRAGAERSQHEQQHAGGDHALPVTAGYLRRDGLILRTAQHDIQVAEDAIRPRRVRNGERGKHFWRARVAGIDALDRQRRRSLQQLADRADIDAIRNDVVGLQGVTENPAVRRHQVDFGRRVDDHRPAGEHVQRFLVDLAVADQRSGVDDVHGERRVQSLTQLLVVQPDTEAVDRVERRAEQEHDDEHGARELVMQVLHAFWRLSATTFIL